MITSIATRHIVFSATADGQLMALPARLRRRVPQIIEKLCLALFADIRRAISASGIGYDNANRWVSVTYANRRIRFTALFEILPKYTRLLAVHCRPNEWTTILRRTHSPNATTKLRVLEVKELVEVTKNGERHQLQVHHEWTQKIHVTRQEPWDCWMWLSIFAPVTGDQAYKLCDEK